MDIHRDYLKNRCRFGNCQLPEDARRSGHKNTFYNKFQEHFRVDVMSEDLDIYPDRLCSQHSSLMHLTKKSRNIDNKSKLFQFKSHSNEFTLFPANSDLSAKDCISSFSIISDTEQRKVFLQELVLTLDEHELVMTSLGEKLSKPIHADAEKMTSKNSRRVV